jgi:hypothetical protein
VKKTVCTICGNELCDGEEWIVPYTYDDQSGLVSDVKLVCTSQTKIKGAIRVHTMIIGHMIRKDFRAFKKTDMER